MKPDLDFSRRDVLSLGSAALAATLIPDVLFGAAPGTGATEGVGYFGRFGVTEKMIREGLGVALSRGGDYADLYFEHSVLNSLGLEDGEVNRGYRQVQLGVGVRVVKGDQTGYGFTEDLTLEALKATARTAAAIADGPGRTAPARFHFVKDLPNRYPVKTRWEDVKTEQRLPILTSLNARAFALDGRVKKVNLGFMDQGSAVLIADSEGRLVEDIRPMTSLYVSCVAEQDGRKETNGYNVAGRADLGYYTPERLE
ncbi:MAG: TldD/PmbA family protein, partial [Thermoanaerobaculia bacterium]|nr:TldD/PmbA family protein [Thermoanaerobaculia bacterium]